TQLTRAFTIDTSGPVIAIQPPLIPPRTSNRRPAVFFTATDPSGVTTTCKIDAGAAVACDGAAGFAAPADLAEGTHTYQVTATDAAGNPSVASIVFDVDLTPPTVTITSGPANPTNDDTPTFAFTTSADTTRARCELDTGEVIDPCTSGVTFPPIAVGAHTFTVTAYDNASPANTASATYPFVLGFCGDGIAQGTEACDGADLRLQSCAGLGGGFTGGTLACTATCTYDTSGCATCGNGIVEPGEDCDGGQLGNATCGSLGFDSGTLRCNGSCTFDTRECFEPANTGFTGKVCFAGVQYPAPGNGSYVAACTENNGVLRSTLDPSPIWSSINGTGTPTQIVNNLHGRGVFPQIDGPAVLLLADTSATNNAFRSSNVGQLSPTTWTQASFASGGMQIELFSARPGGSSNNILGGWHPTLGAVVLHGNFTPATIVASSVGASVTGTVRSIAAGASGATTDVYAAVYGQTPAGAPATGGIYWTCDQIGPMGGMYTQRDNGIAASDKPLVWSLTVDPLSFTTATRTCPTTGGTVGGYANTYYAALRGGGRIYKTVDGGESWAPASTGLPVGAEVYEIALDCFSTSSPVNCPSCRCVDHNLLYAATSVGLYKSINAGSSWTLAGLGGKVVRGVTLQKEHPVGTMPRVFVGVDDAVGIYQANAP
ncbi:MAG TPA: Ig-like domain-containing protein, partial [Kofleriaceae bacterium]|nr:Ig-like domain-containing protein [Kofleriaceae bacterium]